MAEQISILLADDSYQVRQSIKAMLSLESDQFLVVGEAATGEQAVAMAASLKPDVILMDINMPEMDGLTATEQIMAKATPGIVIISVQGEQEYIRRAMQAGASDYLVKPFTWPTLVQAIRTAAGRTRPVPAPAGPTTDGRPRGKVITVFSTKGGVGKTTVAANLACAIAQQTKRSVAAVDLDLEFGSLGSVIGVRPSGSILDLYRLDHPIQQGHLQRVMTSGPHAGVSVLCAPPLPHLASEVEGEPATVIDIMEALRRAYDYVVIDTAVNFRPINLQVLELSDLVLLVSLPEIPALDATVRGLDLLRRRVRVTKVQLVLNRADAAMGITLDEIEKGLGMEIAYRIPSDGAVAVGAGNLGVPFVLRRTRSAIVEAMERIGHGVVNGAVIESGRPSA